MVNEAIENAVASIKRFVRPEHTHLVIDLHKTPNELRDWILLKENYVLESVKKGHYRIRSNEKARARDKVTVKGRMSKGGIDEEFEEILYDRLANWHLTDIETYILEPTIKQILDDITDFLSMEPENTATRVLQEKYWNVAKILDITHI